MSNRISPYEPVHLGLTHAGEAVSWPLAQTMNTNVMIAGQSGSGKTYTINRLIEALARRGLTVFVLDTQGDMGRPPDGATDVDRYVMEFMYGGGGAQINPLRINASRRHGGAFTGVQDAVTAIQYAKGERLGGRQTSMLRRLISETYARHGIEMRDSATWGRPAPDLDALHTLIQEYRLAEASNMGRDFASTVNSIAKRHIREARKAQEEGRESSAESLVSQEDQEELLKTYRWALDQAISSHQKGLGRGIDSNRLEAIEDVVSTMTDSGLYGEDSVGVNPGAINVFGLNLISPSDMLCLIQLLLYRIFGYAVRSCEEQNVGPPRVAVVMDEAKIASVASSSAMSPLSRIATEGRKYGLGMILGLQDLAQVPETVRRMCATKIVLPIESSAWGEAKRLLRIPPAMIQDLQAKRDGLVSIDEGEIRAVQLFKERLCAESMV